MELKLQNGDYVVDGIGGLCRVSGHEELLQRVLFRLSARRGMFPFLKNLGSSLWKLGQLVESERGAAAKQYVVEALEAEKDLQVLSVALVPTNADEANLTVKVKWNGEPFVATLGIKMLEEMADEER